MQNRAGKCKAGCELDTVPAEERPKRSLADDPTFADSLTELDRGLAGDLPLAPPRRRSSDTVSGQAQRPSVSSVSQPVPAPSLAPAPSVPPLASVFDLLRPGPSPIAPPPIAPSPRIPPPAQPTLEPPIAASLLAPPAARTAAPAADIKPYES